MPERRDNRTTLAVERSDLERAVGVGILDRYTADTLWDFLSEGVPGPRFDLTNLLWYAGALVVIGAMTLFSTEAFGRWGGGALALTALAYALLFAAAGNHFWRPRGVRTLGGLLITIAVCMAPLAMFGVQDRLGWWTHGDPHAYGHFFVWVRGSWVFMSLATIAAGLTALHFWRFPFITMPIAVAAWFLSMDLTEWLVSRPPAVGPNQDAIATAAAAWERWTEIRGLLTTGFGVALLVVGWAIDLRGARDFAFWLHLAAALAINGGLYFWLTDDAIEWAAFGAANTALLLLAIFLGRRAYAAFGGIGVASYLGYLSRQVFQDAVMFSFALTAVGLLIITLGYAYYRHERAIGALLNALVPASIARLRPGHGLGPDAAGH